MKNYSLSDLVFQSYQFRQINPDKKRRKKMGLLNLLFQSYQFRQINPDHNRYIPTFQKVEEVSIVSIQADQSRLEKTIKTKTFYLKFQSYQFRQINPDIIMSNRKHKFPTRFQSYQFRQINPD